VILPPLPAAILALHRLRAWERAACAWLPGTYPPRQIQKFSAARPLFLGWNVFLRREHVGRHARRYKMPYTPAITGCPLCPMGTKSRASCPV
jgi:hypothetical protein